MNTTQAEVKQIAREATRETLRSLGLDVDNLSEMQRDFAALRRIRRMQERGTTVFALTVITLVVTGVAALIWERITQ